MICNDWLDILLFKKKPAELAATSIGDGLKNLIIAGVFVGILAGILKYVSYTQVIAATGPLGDLAATLLPEPTLVDIVVSAISTPIGAVIGIIILGIILHIFSLIVGGKGSIANYIGALALINAAIMGTATAIITIIGILAALGGAYIAIQGILGLLSLIVFLWTLVLFILATQAVQQLSLGRAVVAVIIIPLVIAVILAVLLAAVFAAIIAAALSGAAAGGLPV